MKRYLMTFLTAIMTLLCRSCFSFAFFSHVWILHHCMHGDLIQNAMPASRNIPDIRKGIRFDFSVMPGITGTVSWYRMSCSNHPTIRGK